MKDFKVDNYIIIKKAIDPSFAKFLYDYFLMKRQVSSILHETGYISPSNTEWGNWNDEQVPNTYSQYADIAMENLLISLKPKIEKATKIKLIPTYSYARLYKKGDQLKRHKDRSSCEISTTLNLGGENWPIYIEKNPQSGYFNVKGEYISGNTKGRRVLLKPGDMLIYKGTILEHWRNSFEGQNCCQIFLHYNNLKSKISKENLYDGRPCLGLPSGFRNIDLNVLKKISKKLNQNI